MKPIGAVFGEVEGVLFTWSVSRSAWRRSVAALYSPSADALTTPPPSPEGRPSRSKCTAAAGKSQYAKYYDGLIDPKECFLWH